jgi:IS30 family transposase
MSKIYSHLSAEERGVIMAMKVQGCSARHIAQVLERAPSTITRELARNGYKSQSQIGPIGRPRIAGGYNALRAGIRSRRVRRLAQRPRKLRPGAELWAKVLGMLRQCWSPQQIAGTLKEEHPGQPALQASHETIYTAIYAMPRGTLRKELIPLMRQARAARRPPKRGTGTRGTLQDMVSIHLRPPEANERLLPGHWEGDLIVGAGNQSAVGTLVCRKTLFVMLVKMNGATALDALQGYGNAFLPVDEQLRKTLTYDQGKEMALHKKLAEATGLQIYFADPHSPWQRGICENINGLIRQYLPKGTDLSRHSQSDLDQIAWSLNTRPRRSMGYRSPAQVFFTECINRKIDISPIVALGL